MRKFLLPFFILLTICSEKCFGQIDSIYHKDYKYQVGLNLIPAIVFLSGSAIDNNFQQNNYNPKLGLTVKKKVCNNGQLRLGIIYQPIKKFVGTSTQTNDTIYSYSFDYNKPSYFTEFRLGFEFLKNKRRISFFYGADMFFNHLFYQVATSEQKFIVINSPPPIYQTDSLVLNQDFGTMTHKLNNIGIQFLGGLTFPISNRFAFSFQFGISVPIYQYETYYYSNPKYPLIHNSSFFPIESYFSEYPSLNFLTDISLVYRFN